MQEKNKKTPEQIEIERQERERIREAIIKATNSVPASVMNGSQTKAAGWKRAAVAARKLAESKAPDLNKLRNAYGALRVAES